MKINWCKCKNGKPCTDSVFEIKQLLREAKREGEIKCLKDTFEWIQSDFQSIKNIKYDKSYKHLFLEGLGNALKLKKNILRVERKINKDIHEKQNEKKIR